MTRTHTAPNHSLATVLNCDVKEKDLSIPSGLDLCPSFVCSFISYSG